MQIRVTKMNFEEKKTKKTKILEDLKVVLRSFKQAEEKNEVF